MSNSEVTPVGDVTQSEKIDLTLNELCLRDCRTLTAMQLRTRYPAEARSHRNMLQRKQKQGLVRPEFHEFSDFLRHVGPRPCRRATLDRIDNNDPEYGPGRVRWADKSTQNTNKGDTLLFRYSRTGETYTVTRLARLLKLSPSAIRQRRRRGWTDDEIIKGKQDPAPRHTVQAPKETSTRIRNATSPPAPQLSDVERRFWAKDREAEEYRRKNGKEYCLPTISELEEISETKIYPKGYDRKFEHWWGYWWPHVFVDKLPEEAQQALKRLDVGRFKRRHSWEPETNIASLYRWFVAVNKGAEA